MCWGLQKSEVGAVATPEGLKNAVTWICTLQSTTPWAGSREKWKDKAHIDHCSGVRPDDKIRPEGSGKGDISERCREQN